MMWSSCTVARRSSVRGDQILGSALGEETRALIEQYLCRNSDPVTKISEIAITDRNVSNSTRNHSVCDRQRTIDK